MMEYKELGAYPFPYYLFPERARIVLYGAGKVGSSYYKHLQKDDRIEVVQWIDKNYQKLNGQGKPIAGLDQIREVEFDFVLIACAFFPYQMQVRKNDENESNKAAETYMGRY